MNNRISILLLYQFLGLFVVRGGIEFVQFAFLIRLGKQKSIGGNTLAYSIDLCLVTSLSNFGLI